MRILICTPYYKPAFNYGGPVRCLSILGESLALHNHEIYVFSTNANGMSNLEVNLDKPIDINGVTVRYFKRNFQNDYYYSRSFSLAIAKEIHNFDLVYIIGNWTYPFLSACRYAKKFNKPYVISPHGSLKKEAWKGKEIKKNIYFWIFERSLIQKAAFLHYTTVLEKLDSSWLDLHTPNIIIPNAIDLNEFKELPEKGKFRKKFGINPDQKILLSLGRIEPIKGLDITLNSFALVVKKYQNLTLIVAGPDENGHRSKLIKQAISLGILQRIIFTGMLNSTERLQALRDADIFISTSLSENFSISTVEAMAIGLPVIVSDKIGVADDILNSQAGVVIQNNPNLIACEIERLINSPEIVDMFRVNSKSLIEKKYSPESVALQFETLFNTIINNRLSQ